MFLLKMLLVGVKIKIEAKPKLYKELIAYLGIEPSFFMVFESIQNGCYY